MPVRIRLSRVGAKKRPFYRIVVADSRRSRDGKFIDQIGTYNPMLPKDHLERIKIDADKAKEWIQKGAKPSDRVYLFLSNIGVLKKISHTEKTKKHLPKKKAQERAAAQEKETTKTEDKDKTIDETKTSEKDSNDKTITDAKDTLKENEKQKSKDSSVDNDLNKNTKPNDNEIKKEEKKE